ncbi:MAG: hypothetical protein ACRBF0_08555 [Calditrichia bacterium]
MEILFLLILAVVILGIGKLFVVFLQAGLWLLALPFKLLGSVIGLVVGGVALLVFFPVVLAMLVPFLIVGCLVGGFIYVIN